MKNIIEEVAIARSRIHPKGVPFVQEDVHPIGIPFTPKTEASESSLYYSDLEGTPPLSRAQTVEEKPSVKPIAGQTSQHQNG